MTDCTAAGVRTSAAEHRPRFCKARSHTPTHDGLVASATGLVPCAAHDGLSPAHPSHLASQKRNKESSGANDEARARPGRRHIDPVTRSEGSTSGSVARKTGRARVQRPDIHNALKESTNTDTSGSAIRKTVKARVLHTDNTVLPPQHTVIVPAGARHYSPSMQQQTSNHIDTEEGKENAPQKGSNTMCDDPARIARDMSKTSLEQAEARLRLLVKNGRQASPSPTPVISVQQQEEKAGSATVQAAAAALLASAAAHKGGATTAAGSQDDGSAVVDIVRAEEKLSRQAANATYAEDCARRASQTSAHTGRNHTQGGELGAVSPVIAREIPYAVQDAQPRSDAQPAVPRGAHLLRHDCNRSTSPWWFSTMTTKDNASPSPEPVWTGRPVHDRHLHDGPVPYDTTTTSGEAYPNTPPVGVRCGVMQRHRLTRPAPTGCTTAQTRCLDDTDTLALKRARMNAARKSAERPAFLYGTEKSPSTAVAHSSSAERPVVQAHKVLRYSVEARWKRQEETQRRTGRARIAQPPHNTALW